MKSNLADAVPLLVVCALMLCASVYVAYNLDGAAGVDEQRQDRFWASIDAD